MNFPFTNENTAYVGLDISISSTGFFVCYEDGEPAGGGRIQSKPGKIDTVRFMDIRDRLLETVASNVSRDSYFLIENYAFAAPKQTGGQITRIAELTGIIKEALVTRARADRIWICAPGTLKKFCTGKGNAPKELMIREVFRKWNFMAKDNNEADAFSLMKLMHKAIVDKDVTKYEKEAITSLRKTNKEIMEYDTATPEKGIKSRGKKTLKKEINQIKPRKLIKRGS